MTAYSRRTQIGNVFQDSYGDEFLIYLHEYADEEPNEVQITGRACDIIFDPSSPAGRAGVLTLIDRLREALREHELACQRLYGKLSVGDFCVEIREPVGDEPRCAYVFNGPIAHPRCPRCSRVEHTDGHHVAVDDDYVVTAVTHPRPIYVDEAPRAFGMPAAELFEQMMRAGRKDGMTVTHPRPLDGLRAEQNAAWEAELRRALRGDG